jgi:hypothetical protein
MIPDEFLVEQDALARVAEEAAVRGTDAQLVGMDAP